MTYPKALFGGLALIAAALLVGQLSPVMGQMAGAGGYAIASDGRAIVWRVNTGTGAVSYCARRADNTDTATLSRQQPSCSQWSSGG